MTKLQYQRWLAKGERLRVGRKRMRADKNRQIAGILKKAAQAAKKGE